MIKQLFRDESGMALGIAIFVMVIVGVMGAGLLVFVRNDLEAVIEVNQGQRAFDIADAGAQVAKQQILGDKVPSHYDVEATAHPDYIAASCNTDSNDPDDATDTANDIQRAPAGENWAPDGGGQTRSFADGQFTVTARWLNQDPSVDARCRAPETTTSPVPGVDYFKVISTGKYRNATRRIETVYETYDLNVPRAYYTPGKITLSGTAKISKVSLFTSSDIEVKGGAEVTGEDLAYKAWAAPSFPNTFNSTARPTTNAGLGAAGQITYTGGATSQLGTRDFDSDPSNTRPGPNFVLSPSDPQLANEITFPFDLASQPDANRLCDEAKAQGNYTADPTTSSTTNFPNWPDSSSNQTVVCYEFTNIGNSHSLRWTVGGNETLAAPYADCKGPIKRGTLVIRNGGFSIKSGSNVALFRGVVVTRGPEALQDSEVGDAALTGNNCLDGFVNSTGPIKIAGSVTPASSEEANDRPGFFGVRTWGWRELYQ